MIGSVDVMSIPNDRFTSVRDSRPRTACAATSPARSRATSPRRRLRAGTRTVTSTGDALSLASSTNVLKKPCDPSAKSQRVAGATRRAAVAAVSARVPAHRAFDRERHRRRRAHDRRRGRVRARGCRRDSCSGVFAVDAVRGAARRAALRQEIDHDRRIGGRRIRQRSRRDRRTRPSRLRRTNT